MTTNDENVSQNEMKVVVRKDGSYKVSGGVPLVRMLQVVTEYGEPVAWQLEAVLETEEPYFLCRCGHSSAKPFCDATHRKIGFEGTETADVRPTAVRQVRLSGGQKIIVRRDYSLCMEAGFCANRFTNIDRMLADDADPVVLEQIIAMIGRCPSGSYTFSFPGEEANREPDLPRQIAVITEMTDEGPIMGPLWVTGNIPIERSDGQPLENRNRVTLCRCGLSRIKPLCDGTHRRLNIKED